MTQNINQHPQFNDFLNQNSAFISRNVPELLGEFDTAWGIPEQLSFVLASLRKLARNQNILNHEFDSVTNGLIMVIGDILKEFEIEWTTEMNSIWNQINDLYQFSGMPLEKTIQHQKAIKSFNPFSEDRKEFMQGFSINTEKDEIYIGRKSNGQTNCSITRYKFSTMEFIDTKTYATSTGPYPEGLSYFYNDDNHLCFVVRVQFENGMAIFDYNTGTLSTPFTVAGNFKMSTDYERKYLISCYGSSLYVMGAYLYDFNSIAKDKTPKLFKKITFPSSIVYGNKIQGLTIIDNFIYLAQGGTAPTISVLNMNGDLLYTYDLNKSDLLKIFKDYNPEENASENWRYETEGVTFMEYEHKILPVYSHIVDSRTVYLAVAGLPDFKKISLTSYNENYKMGINWFDLPLADGITSYGPDSIPQYCREPNGIVRLRGTVTHTHIEGGSPNLILATLPYLTVPDRNQFFITPAHSNPEVFSAVNRIGIGTNGQVKLIQTNSPQTDKPFTCLDGISYYTAQ